MPSGQGRAPPSRDWVHAMTEMRGLEDNSVDAVVTDPPLPCDRFRCTGEWPQGVGGVCARRETCRRYLDPVDQCHRYPLREGLQSCGDYWPVSASKWSTP
jgi:hypothetical protein